MKHLAAVLLSCFCISPAHATRWIVDTRVSRLGFAVQWSGEPFVAIFRKWTAAISFDPADLAHARIAADIDLGSESSDTPENDDGLKGPEGFSIGHFPTAHFESRRIVSTGANTYLATGTLSLHGVTRPVRLPFTLRIQNGVAHVTAKTDLFRNAFGLGAGEWAGDSPIAQRVSVDLALTAAQAP
ncbi:MAG: YceI family protein [Alphaproteobacteria bacterium]|nr:YceI family protein [Alphaproteobacteria bacterium]